MDGGELSKFKRKYDSLKSAHAVLSVEVITLRKRVAEVVVLRTALERVTRILPSYYGGWSVNTRSQEAYRVAVEALEEE